MAASPHSSYLLPVDWTSDDFFLSRRISLSDSPSGSDSLEFSRARALNSEPDSYFSDEQIIAIGSDPHPIQSEDFEWEEVEGNNNDLGWEVLMDRTALDPEDTDSFLVEYTSDYESYDVVVSHLSDHESFLKSRPPAAKSVIETLPSVNLTKDLSEEEIQCAVCRDLIGLDARVKRLPCMHYYHEECILPWLSVRNTCPLCRHELPTDDLEYEDWKARRGVNLDNSSLN